MKTFQNPTKYFFQQSANPPTEYREKIDIFVKQLIDLDQCILCKENFNFIEKIPRILIHCGHTFCSNCLQNFYKNMRIRCPLCLKLIRNIETIERLPINHTIFTKMAQQLNENNKLNGQEEIDLQAALYQQFEQNSMPQGQEVQQQQQQQMMQQGHQMNNQAMLQDPQFQNGPMLDQESGLFFCEFHPDRIKHFFCMAHKDTCCRVCQEMLHNKNDCMIVELYEIEDMHTFLSEFQKNQHEDVKQQIHPHQVDSLAQHHVNHAVMGETAQQNQFEGQFKKQLFDEDLFNGKQALFNDCQFEDDNQVLFDNDEEQEMSPQSI